MGVTAAVVDLMRRLQQRPRVLVSASAVGFYGASPRRVVRAARRARPARPGQFQSDLCAAIEHEARRAEALGVRVVRMRFGVVLGRGDGAYPMLALSARLGLGAVLGSGRQPAPWIHLDDAVGLLRFALADGGLAGPSTPSRRTPDQADFARALAASFGRRVLAARAARARCAGRWARWPSCCWKARTRCRRRRWRPATASATRRWRARSQRWPGVRWRAPDGRAPRRFRVLSPNAVHRGTLVAGPVHKAHCRLAPRRRSRGPGRRAATRLPQDLA